MTRSAPQTPPSGTSETESASPAGVKSGRKRLRLWVALVAGVAALLCLGGVGVAVLLYDKETKVDRATPDQVTSSFLRSYLGDRSDQEASLYTCRANASLGEIASLRQEMIDRENKFGTTVTASWESLTVSDVPPNQKSVAVDLVIAGAAHGQQVSSRTESWTFSLVDQDGWRVCSGKRAG